MFTSRETLEIEFFSLELGAKTWMDGAQQIGGREEGPECVR